MSKDNLEILKEIKEFERGLKNILLEGQGRGSYESAITHIDLVNSGFEYEEKFHQSLADKAEAILDSLLENDEDDDPALNCENLNQLKTIIAEIFVAIEEKRVWVASDEIAGSIGDVMCILGMFPAADPERKYDEGSPWSMSQNLNRFQDKLAEDYLLHKERFQELLDCINEAEENLYRPYALSLGLEQGKQSVKAARPQPKPF